MNLIHAIRGPAGILLWLASVVLASLTVAMPAALAAPRPRPPGWNKHPPLPAHIHPLATGGIPGWQLTLMAVTVVLLAATLVAIVYPGPGRAAASAASAPTLASSGWSIQRTPSPEGGGTLMRTFRKLQAQKLHLTVATTPCRLGGWRNAMPILRHWSSRRTRLALVPVFLALTLSLVPSLSATATPLSRTAGSAADLATVVYPVHGSAPPANIWRHIPGTATFTVTVTNNGPNTAANVTVTNTVTFASLAGITATPTTVSCSVSAGSCTEPQLRSGASITITVTVHYTEVIHNMLFNDRATATSTTPDPNTANNSALGYYVIR
jgi:uncharacterized repeat protein (TIGR01451 family)